MHVERRNDLTLSLLVLVTLGSSLDIAMDVQHGAPLAHLAPEGAAMVAATFFLLLVLRDIRRQAMHIKRLETDLVAIRERADARPPALANARNRLAEAAQEQFAGWRLTEGEQEVAWLLLKGLRPTEIAARRETNDKGVRQQASTIYGKANLPGQHAFIAWFLGDLL